MKALITGLCASIGTVVLAQPALQFSAGSYSVNESEPTVTITVQRKGDAGPAVSVDYATADGTAACGRNRPPGLRSCNFCFRRS